MKRCGKRLLGVLLAAVMLLGSFPALITPAEASSGDKGQYLEVWLGYGRIGNGDCADNGSAKDVTNGFAPTNLYQNFKNNVYGFEMYEHGGIGEWEGNGFGVDTGEHCYMRVTISKNDLLLALSKSPTAQYKVDGYVKTSDSDWHTSKAHYDYDQADITIKDVRNGTTTTRASAHSPRDDYATAGYDTGWQSFTGLSEIYVLVDSYNKRGGGHNADDTEAKAYINFYIRDTAKPELQSYTCTNGATVNSENSKELLVKLGIKNADDPDNYYYAAADYNSDESAMISRNWIDMQFNFSKPVTLGTPKADGSVTPAGQSEFETLASHTLFTNTVGTGYLGEGDNRGLTLYQTKDMKNGLHGGGANGGKVGKAKLGDLNYYLTSLYYGYAATYGDFSSNAAIPAGGGIESSSDYRFGTSLFEKLVSVGFHDAAGNPLATPGGSAGSNIFDKNDGGYDVIVDAVPPTYTRTGNGIAPDILTQLVLNGNDSVDFIVSFSEATITRRGWDNTKTYLMLNNGDRAYFTKKSADGKQWIFNYHFKYDTAEEASLLKVIALANDALDSSLRSDSTGKESRGNDSAYTFNADGRTVTDYVGNFMVDRANEDSSTNSSQIESSTTWAGLTVDNTPPGITFSYSVYGAGSLTKGTDNEWGQAAKVMPIAADPAVPVAKYDPDYTSSNTTRPSKGIYRPDNTTGSTASAVGLVFYTWSRSETAPATGDNFAAIKRYSLTGEQPGTVTGADYASAWADYSLMMANNYSEIAPPDEAMTGAGDGAWYLHVWTADMTWDSARQLRQYALASAIQYLEGKTNADLIALKQKKMEAYRAGQMPTIEEAWAAVKAAVYQAVFKTEFLARLDANYSDTSLASAESALRTEAAAQVVVFNEGYSAADLDPTQDGAAKTAVEAYLTAHTPTAAAAWTAVKESVYESVYTVHFVELLNEYVAANSGAAIDSDAALTYALRKLQYKENYTADDLDHTKNGYAKTQVDAYISAHNTTEDEAWAEVRSDVFNTVYADTFLAFLGRVTPAEAAALADEDLTAAVTAALANSATYIVNITAAGSDFGNAIYKGSYDAATAETEKDSRIDAYIQANPKTGTGDDEHDTTEDEAWDALREAFYRDVYTDAFLAYLGGLSSYALTGEALTAAVTAALGRDGTYTADAAAAIQALRYNTYTTETNTTLTYYTEADLDYTQTGAAKTAVEKYVQSNTPDADTAWGEKMDEVCSLVYNADFLARLKASGMPVDSQNAVAFLKAEMVDEIVQNMEYLAGQDSSTLAELKAQKISEHRLEAAGADVSSAENVWKAVQAAVYADIYTAQFIGWLGHSGHTFYDDEDMLYALTQAMLTMTQYENTGVWKLEYFTEKDSNWTLATTRLLLDNTPPAAEAVYQVDNMIGNETAAVELPFTVSDATGGIQTDSVYYQWVKVKEDESQTYEEVQWLQVTADQTVDVSGGLTDASYGAASATYTAKTLGNVDGDGEYILYLKYSDVAGNTTVTNSGELRVTVDASNAAVCAFGPETAISGWSKKIVPTFTVSGVAVGRAEYAVTDSTERPTSGFTAISADEEGGASFTLPELDKADGTWYVHVLIYENANQTVEPRYFRQLYRLDRTGPEIFFNPDGFTEVQDSATVAVSFLDSLSGIGDGAVYRISDGTEEIADGEEGWETVPSSGRITLSVEETGNYYLHVRAKDKAENVTYQVSAAYALRSGSAPASVLPAYGSEILSVYTVDGKTYAAANLFLDTEDKTDYRYSISTDGGETWCNWLPYMSMIRIRLPAEYPAGTLRVKFRGPDGTVGPETNIATLSLDNAIWATAEFDSTFKRQTGKTLTFLMTLPEGVTAEEKVEDGAVAETTKLENGNFTVTANGVYEFALTRGGQTAESTLIVVVDIFDDTAPEGYISYSEVAPTNGSVIAAVKANEPIYVKTLMVKYDGDADYSAETPKAQFSFQRNGTAVFTVVDEAGNERDVTATVRNIDKTGPQVLIGTDYELYETVGTGAELIASGVTLEVRKETSAGEDFTVVNNDQYRTMEVGVNGTYSFIVQDRVGNVTQAQHVVSNVVTTLPDYTVTYTYLDGSPVTEGVWKQDKVVATVTFDAVTDGRKLYGGAAIVDEDRQVVKWNNTTNAGETRTEHVSNELSMSEGKYVYSRTYTANGETSLVVCDSLGNVERIPITVTGIDNTPPTLTLDKSTAVISNDQPKRLPEMSAAERIALLGGYTVTDNVYTDGFAVTVARSDDSRQASNDDKGKLTEVGKFTLIYTVTDPAGNVSYAEQTLIVIPSDGLLIEAGKDGDYALLSGLSANSSILPDNHVTFRIDKARMQAMFYSGDNGRETVHNDMAEYEILYVSGLYREGQLKTIATRVAKTTAAEMGESMTFSITFPKPGWYTIIIRNQERTREYTTFFIAATSGDA